MKYNKDKERFTLSTGKEISANRGIIGINNDMEISEGYDGEFIMPEDDWMDFDDRLTNAECVEIADHMLTQWQKFKEKYSA